MLGTSCPDLKGCGQSKQREAAAKYLPQVVSHLARVASGQSRAVQFLVRGWMGQVSTVDGWACLLLKNKESRSSEFRSKILYLKALEARCVLAFGDFLILEEKYNTLIIYYVAWQ